jgi:hypothetical protein
MRSKNHNLFRIKRRKITKIKSENAMKNFKQKNLLNFAGKISVVSFVFLFLSFVYASPASAQLINEINVNPAGVDNPCEYIEIRGTAGATIAANTYYVEVDGDGTNAGNANFVVNLSGLVYGTNGLITIASSTACGTRNYATGGSTVVTDPQLDTTNGGIQNGTGTFFIVSSGTAIVEGTDYDTNDDGVLEGVLAAATIIDSIAISDGAVGDDTYAPVLSTAGTTINAAPDAFTRFPSNNTANSAAAFYYGDLTGAQADTTYSATARSANFPSSGALTPGTANVGPTAAGATVGGRISTTRGRGVPYAMLMLSGGDLEEPIDATTGTFGYYQFPEVATGKTYILQIFSRRYTFDPSSRVINLNDNFTDADFVGTETWSNSRIR